VVCSSRYKIYSLELLAYGLCRLLNIWLAKNAVNHRQAIDASGDELRRIMLINTSNRDYGNVESLFGLNQGL
jgi:hypothetical protein